MYVNVSQRFIQAVDYLIGCKRLKNQADLSARLSLSKGYVSQIVQGKREPSEQVVSKFANIFPEVNRTWLLTGDGDMLTAPPAGNTQVIGSNHGTAINGGAQAPASADAQFREYAMRKDAQVDELLSQNGRLIRIIERLTEEKK